MPKDSEPDNLSVSIWKTTYNFMLYNHDVLKVLWKKFILQNACILFLLWRCGDCKQQSLHKHAPY